MLGLRHLRLSRFLFACLDREVVSDRAAGNCAENRVMMCEMAGYCAEGGTFQASSLSRCGHNRREDQGETWSGCISFHSRPLWATGMKVG